MRASFAALGPVLCERHINKYDARGAGLRTCSMYFNRELRKRKNIYLCATTVDFVYHVHAATTTYHCANNALHETGGTNSNAAVIALSTVKLHGHSHIVASSSKIVVVTSPLSSVENTTCIRRGDDGGVMSGMMGIEHGAFWEQYSSFSHSSTRSLLP